MSVSSAFEIVSQYTSALSAGDSKCMDSLRSSDFVLDWVYGDAFETPPISEQETEKFWSSWFTSFPEMDFEVSRTIAAMEVVVTEWVFTGTNSGPLLPPAFGSERESTGKTIQFRGVSIYDVIDGLIRRETLYMDLATVMVELGIVL